MTAIPSNDSKSIGPTARRIAKYTRLVSAIILLVATDFGFGVRSQQRSQQRLATARLIATPAMQFPSYLKPAIDPVFKTSFTRVTDPGRHILPGAVCNKKYCRHRYSSTQAWNADQSLLVLTKGCRDFCFLDGQSYKPLFWRNIPRSHDCNWHPVDPKLMICVGNTSIYTWAPQANTRTLIYAPSNYEQMQFGPWSGNPSEDGHRLVVRARNKQNDLVVFAYDIAKKKKYPDIELAGLNGKNKYATISPSGRYIYFAQETQWGIEPAYVYTVDGKQIQYWAEHHRPGHGDMTIDSDGNDVYVGISKSDPDKFHVIKRRLKDGLVTSLAPYGGAGHASTRNINRPGWVFLSYYGTQSNVVDEQYPVPFYREAIALRIDGSGEIRRLVHTRNADHNYISETHASPSPDGTQVIWSSNWEKPGGPVADYVARLSWNEPSQKNSPR